MNTTLRFLTFYATLSVFAYMGWQLIVADHPVAGGWLIAGAIIGLLATNWSESKEG